MVEAGPLRKMAGGWGLDEVVFTAPSSALPGKTIGHIGGRGDVIEGDREGEIILWVGIVGMGTRVSASVRVVPSFGRWGGLHIPR